MNIKYLHSLQQKKFRDADNVFIAEGIKTVSDILSMNVVPVALLYCYGNKQLPQIIIDNGEEVPYKTIERISGFKTPQQVFAVFKKFEQQQIDFKDFSNFNGGNILFLDNVSDPGNLGTIIRSADWFGIENIVCSNHTVDMYNPKVIQSTMGAIANVNILYVDTLQFLQSAQKIGLPIVGTFMEGDDIKSFDAPKQAIYIIGNEANGISEEVKEYVSMKLSIPSISTPTHTKVSESLNAAVTASILCFYLSGRA